MFKEYFTMYQIPSHMYEKLRKTEGIKNDMLNQMKKSHEKRV